MQSRIERFNDVHLHARAIQGWQQTYDQLSTGHAQTLLQHVTGERFQIFQETLDKRVVQQGVAPMGRICLAMPLSLSEPVLFQGKSVNAESVSLLQGGQEFSVQAAEGMELLAITVQAERFHSFANREFTTAQLRRLGNMANLELAQDLLNTVRQRLMELVAATQVNTHFPENIVEDATFQSMLDLLDHGTEQDRARLGNHTVSAYLVRQSQELALANTEEPSTVLDICEHLKVSRRTLQRSFLSVTGMRPVEYLRSVRLNAVRRRLRATSAECYTVARVASDFGFTHLGHFSGAYKALFAEQPSETPRAR